MTVRHFDGTDDVITTAAGGLAALDGGPITIAVLWRASSVSAQNIIHAKDVTGGSGGGGVWNMNPYSDGNVYWGTNEGSPPGGFATVTSYAADEWYLTAATKGNGSAQSRGHRYVYSTDTWAHTDVGSPFGDSDRNPIVHVFIGRQTDDAEFLHGELAVMGVWEAVLSDGDLEGLTTNLDDWLDASPDALWAFNQASVADPVLDLTGNGADQTAITGTTVLEGDDPPGFSFGAIDLTVADLEQGQILESPALTQVHVLTVAELAQAQTLESPALTQVHVLTVAELAQAQALESPALTQLHELTIAELEQGQTLSSPALGTGGAVPMPLPATGAHTRVLVAIGEDGRTA